MIRVLTRATMGKWRGGGIVEKYLREKIDRTVYLVKCEGMGAGKHFES